ncbi:MAG: sel1 repeat family protein, partial [Neisseriaceae bacterium]|nr:sel1 repeat family protein [Neisseriaceae bacterium]
QASLDGKAAAQNDLAFLYQKGLGGALDLSQAKEWYEKAANQDYSTAQYNLGYLYEKGLGVKKDLNKAREWYEKAAEQNNVEALYALALLYQDLEIDRTKFWLKKACDLEYQQACEKLNTLS